MAAPTIRDVLCEHLDVTRFYYEVEEKSDGNVRITLNIYQRDTYAMHGQGEEDPRPKKKRARVSDDYDWANYESAAEFSDAKSAAESDCLSTVGSANEDDEAMGSTNELPSNELPLGVSLSNNQEEDGEAKLSNAELMQIYCTVGKLERGRKYPTVFDVKGKFRKAFKYLTDLKESKLYTWKQLAVNEITDNDYLEMYQLLSHKQRYDVAPTVFNNKGAFRREQGRLAKLASQRSAPIDRRRHHGFRARNRCYLAVVAIESHMIFCSAFETYSPNETKAIMIGFTRASGSPPRYGTHGMFQRGQRAVEGYADLKGNNYIIKMVVPRYNVSSPRHFFNHQNSVEKPSGHSLDEVWAVLDSAADGRLIYFLSVGLDGFTTSLTNYSKIAEKWPALNIVLVVVVPSWFPGSKEAFPIATNGIRYGAFKLAEIQRALAGSTVNPTVNEFLKAYRYDQF
jgi:hypothetical protein